MSRGTQNVTWRDYADHYGDSLGRYLRRAHLEPYTKGNDSHARFRCRRCGAAITIHPIEGTEFGHYRSSRGAWSEGMCPHRDEDTVGANGAPGVGREKGTVPGSAD